MENLFTFILTIVANVVADCICKWLDDQFRPGKH